MFDAAAPHSEPVSSPYKLHASGRTDVRLGYCEDILTTRERLQNLPEGKNAIHARVLAENRINALRRVLLGRQPKKADELLSPSKGLHRLNDMLSDALAAAGADAAEVARVKAYGRAIYEMQQTIFRAERTNGLLETVPSYDERGLTVLESTLEHKPEDVTHGNDNIVATTIEKGRCDSALRDELARVPSGSQIEDELSRKESYLNKDELQKHETLIALRNGARMTWDEAQDELERATGELMQAQYNGASEDDIRELKAARDEAVRREEAALEARKEVNKQIQDYENQVVVPAKVRKRQELHAKAKEAGGKFIANLIDASPVGAESAKAWADGVEITKAAAARLKKVGYPIAQVRADMAEFFRLTGGRVTAVKLDSKGDRRANTTGIYSVNNAGTVYMDGRFDKRVLWHELGHHIESDPVARAAAGRFIRLRAKNSKATRRLKDLTGNAGYKRDEVAFEDSFFSPYIGKYYRDGVTEVFSMGVESFSDPMLLAERMTKDAQTLEFVAGFLKGGPDELAKTYLDLHEATRTMHGDTLEAKETAADELLTQLAGKAKPIDRNPELPPHVAAFIERRSVKLVGQVDLLRYVFSERVRVPATRRSVIGFTICTFDGNFVRFCSEYPSKDERYWKAALAVFDNHGFLPTFAQLNDPEYLRQEI
jgi:hypothetical protein